MSLRSILAQEGLIVKSAGSASQVLRWLKKYRAADGLKVESIHSLDGEVPREVFNPGDRFLEWTYTKSFKRHPIYSDMGGEVDEPVTYLWAIGANGLPDPYQDGLGHAKGHVKKVAKSASSDKVGGYDKSVWAQVPRKIQGLILTHLGRPRVPGVSDPIPYYTGMLRTHFVPTKNLGVIDGSEFVLGSDHDEPVVQWVHPEGGVSYFLSPMPD